MEFLMDPSIWVGLLTLVVLEIVLGIDNLVFIAILADKLPPKQRDKARLIGLSLALVMRLGLLSVISWMVTLTKPLFSVMDFTFSGRDLIMLLGGYSCFSKRRRSCMNGWKTASTMMVTVKAMPVSGWWCCRSWCWMPSSRWMR
jgi:predicted tellurium resistance membrane protein TerC